MSKEISCLLLAACALAFLASCGKPDAESQSAPQSEHPSGSTSRAAGEPFDLATSSGVDMVFLPGGEFLMGSPKGNADESPSHEVRVSAFAMDKFEVTHAMFTTAQLPNPSHWQESPNLPVERVRWRDAKQYCNERSLLEKLKPCYNEKSLDWDCDYSANGYRLPTEAEWEFAARAGADAVADLSQPDKLRQYAWFAANADQKTHPAGQKKPNRWGIHDLFGNVSEWCEDVYSPTYYRESPGLDSTGPPNSGQDVKRVIRGGSWKSSVEACRPTARQGEKTGDSDACFSTDFCGFRCVRRGTAEELKKLARAR